MARSGDQHAIREMAQAIGMSYAFGVERLEPAAEKGKSGGEMYEQRKRRASAASVVAQLRRRWASIHW